MLSGEKVQPFKLYKLKKTKIDYYSVAIFWLLQVNPISIWVMSESSGLGYGSIRSVSYISGAVILFLAVLIGIVMDRDQGFSVTKIIIRFISVLFFIVCLRIFLDLNTGGGLDFVGVFPFVEFLMSSILFSRINVYRWLNSNIDNLKTTAAVIMLTDVLLWMYSIRNGISFGVFRANIGGLEINRMPDLFYSGIASVMIFDRKSKTRYRLIALLMIIITLYRSAYLSSISVAIYCFWLKRERFRFHDYLYRGFFVCVLFLTTLTIISFLMYGNHSLVELLFDRFTSTFTADDYDYGEASKSQRLMQIQPLVSALAENIVFGGGFGFVLLEEPIYNYFNYILISLVMLGLPLVVGAFQPAIFLFKKLILVDRTELNSVTLYLNGVVVYFLVLINIFPYMVYFPISSIFAFGICYHLWRAQERPLKARTIVAG